MGASVIDELGELASLLGYTESGIVKELTEMLRARVSFLLRAADFARDGQVEQYLTELLKRRPTADEVALSRRARRRLRLTDAEIENLEQAQCDRCKLCGKFLDLEAKPHVDHIVPLAHGGEDKLENLQLLCGACNLGKNDLSSWLLGIPYQAQTRSERLRYVVLSRAAGLCSSESCDGSSANTQLELVSRVPLAKGGRWIFDNLLVLCREHAAKTNAERGQATREALARSGRKSTRKISS